MRERRDRGETLIEIVITVVITSITITALVSSLATTGAAGVAQRNRADADTVMRNYAEATKQGARSCVVGDTYLVDYTVPAGYTAVAEPAGDVCPDASSVKRITLTVTDPTGVTDSMQIAIRTP